MTSNTRTPVVIPVSRNITQIIRAEYTMRRYIHSPSRFDAVVCNYMRRQSSLPHVFGICFICAIIVSLMGCDDAPDTPLPNTPLDNPTIQSVDTTSHEYTWMTWHFGDTPTSVLNSVSAIHDDLAIAVGHITFRNTDTTKSGRWSNYNAMKWDGAEWSPFKVLWQSIHDGEPRGGIKRYDTAYVSARATVQSVWGEAPNNWSFYPTANYWDGTTWATERFFIRGDSVAMFRFWGPERDRWYWGVNGYIVHGSGRNFKIQHRVVYDAIRGVAGNKDEAWAVGIGYPLWSNPFVLHYKYGTWQKLDFHLASSLNSTHAVWSDDIGANPGGSVVMVGSNIILYDSTWDNVTRPLGPLKLPHPRYFRCVHGTGRNNIWAGGDRGVVAHYNGKSWRHYPELNNEDISYYGAWATKTRVFLVGKEGYQAVITVGTRVNK
jgi:hypothetical protein